MCFNFVQVQSLHFGFHRSFARSENQETINIFGQFFLQLIEHYFRIFINVQEKKTISCSRFTKFVNGDCRGDFSALRNTSSIFKRVGWMSQQFLDMDPLFRVMEDFMVWPFESEKKGLSGLVQKILGRPLDKTLQVSSWGDRPLGASHAVYAALDAYVLLLVISQVLT